MSHMVGATWVSPLASGMKDGPHHCAFQTRFLYWSSRRLWGGFRPREGRGGGARVWGNNANPGGQVSPLLYGVNRGTRLPW